MEKIRKGSFVRIESGWGDKHWCEVMTDPRVYMSPDREYVYKARAHTEPERSADGRFWYYTLAPDSAHKDMVKEVLNLDPAVADIFRETTMKER